MTLHTIIHNGVKYKPGHTVKEALGYFHQGVKDAEYYRAVARMAARTASCSSVALSPARRASTPTMPAAPRAATRPATPALSQLREIEIIGGSSSTRQVVREGLSKVPAKVRNALAARGLTITLVASTLVDGAQGVTCSGAGKPPTIRLAAHAAALLSSTTHELAHAVDDVLLGHASTKQPWADLARDCRGKYRFYFSGEGSHDDSELFAWTLSRLWLDPDVTKFPAHEYAEKLVNDLCV